MRKAEIYNNGILAGVLTETDEGRYLFRYDDAFLADERQTAISLSFPKREKEFESDTLFPFFYNMLAEGANKAYQCRTLKIDEEDARFHRLLDMIFYLCELAGFRIEGRIVLTDKRTGRIWR